jgi:hypothetical protein
LERHLERPLPLTSRHLDWWVRSVGGAPAGDPSQNGRLEPAGPDGQGMGTQGERHLERHLDWWVRSGGGSPAGWPQNGLLTPRPLHHTT